MSYQVLARKWRPRIFSELVGQEHVVQALSNALDSDRLHHAYLFTGTRGVGKTTLARIFAKSLNCENGVGSTPCGQCSSCQEIDQGRFVDLLEVDAASRTKVDQTRELLDNVPYAPVRGRYKVYLIDEVHMFSGGSFNALLKTLEEPPPHVKFLLATTDPQKVPVTVLSRCLQFNLKRLPLPQIRDYLQQLLQRESIEYQLPALTLLARGADGSMRDALSLMDQAIAFGGGQVMEEEVRSMLGATAQDRVHELVAALASGDATALMALVDGLAEMAPDFAGVLQDLLLLLHRIALQQVVPDAIDDSSGDREQLAALAELLSAEDVQLFYQIGLIGQRDLPLAPDPRSGFEMVLLRMLAFRPAVAAQPAVSAPATKKKAAEALTPVASTADNRAPAASASRVAEDAPQVPSPDTAAIDPSQWPQLVASLKLGGIARQLANNCIFDSWDGRVLCLQLDASHRQMRVSSSEGRLHAALQQLLGVSLKLQIDVRELDGTATPAQLDSQSRQQRQQQAEQQIANDPLVQALGDALGAEVVPGSVQIIADEPAAEQQ